MFGAAVLKRTAALFVVLFYIKYIGFILFFTMSYKKRKIPQPTLESRICIGYNSHVMSST